MDSFIKQVLQDLNDKNVSLDTIVFVLPSKRAGVFLKNELSTLLRRPIFSPSIISIEEFVEELSDLKLLPDSELIFKLYESYLKLTPQDEQEPFESFFTWANVLLQDFNEIDRYLINQNNIFDYLKAIKELNHWSLAENQTPLIKQHLKFWNKLKQFYKTFARDLLKNNQGYQGLLYREACNNLELYMVNHPKLNHVFLGFNALNTSEKRIIQELIDNDLAQIYWDIDSTFLNDKYHDAGLFIREYTSNWKHFKNGPLKWASNTYREAKSIKAIGVPKNVGQAKYIGQLLETIHSKKRSLEHVAVVLGEENLLLPLLNSLPESINSINVTMGLPLKFVPLANLFISLFNLHKQSSNSFYYKDVVDLLVLPSVYRLFQQNSSNKANELIEYIQQNNIIYLDTEKIKSIIPDEENSIDLIFGSWDDNPQIAIERISALIYKIKEQLDPSVQRLEMEYLYCFHNLFNRLNDLHSQYNYLENISSLYTLFKELLNMETMDFQGEPLEGLQIMGMLESRALDFETVIISSVNEGILPAGKTNNSFIPYDVKIENALPTFKEKDAVYTYHFYRLLQRAKEVYIIYNTESDALKGGEKSRFIAQLEVEGIHSIEQVLAQPQIPVIDALNKTIKKTPELIKEIKALAEGGFSPSSLTSYIRNPLDFYYEKLLKIKEFEDVEESIAANTLGTVIHNTLEQFYKPYENCTLTEELLLSFKEKVQEAVANEFKATYKEGGFTKGKNLIVFEIAQHFILNFIDIELESIKKGNTIKILAIETDESTSLQIEGLDIPIIIKGKVDRVDEFNGVIRIIDYKSGKVEKNKVVIGVWNEIATDYNKYSKPFQLLCYTYMMFKQNKITLPVEAGIYSFKNLSAGLLKFTKINPDQKNKRDEAITEETLRAFENELHKLILEIFNPAIDFIEKETD
ncbi:PD-(D/E)XK nuclease family protein [Winogradskyella sp. DF17]|uniref:PD-(D/E)XK nuclease family protein n=1 Tax=Winogradskyella pelagia TaxID=2819984 RepID=A0ABS3SXY2_9FLAO|nr:UrvD/REP family ATP-dependent DNA helicase [Winogradskyella sp. DF17]MBO3115332.1 PD-(D/E)XK nuclease family protein [Winogradskyella sp. DF17]